MEKSETQSTVSANVCPSGPQFPYQCPVHVALISVNPSIRLVPILGNDCTILMAKGASSKDKKSGEKGKGKAEETADKGKVREIPDPFFILLC